MERSSPRLLVVEDDEASRALYAELFAEAGIDARCVDPETLPELDGFRAVLTDLPGRDEYSSARAREWITRLSGRYGVPVFVVTGRHEAMRDASLRPCASILEKPFDVEQLVTTIRATVDGSPS